LKLTLENFKEAFLAQPIGEKKYDTAVRQKQQRYKNEYQYL